ncbi:hypothetical protein VZO05_09295 [Aggregatilineales bacterium SYSU G02658]
MVELYSMMWIFALAFGIIGFLRGWNQELVATGGLLLAMFAILQFDNATRGLLFFTLPREQIFLIELAILLFITFTVYQNRELRGVQARARNNLGAGVLGAVVGFLNGYLLGGGIWYLLDINEYPFQQFITAPAVNSPSAQNINTIPLVLVGGGASGTGDLLAVIVIVMLFIVFVLL